MALKNICWEGYTQFSSEPALGMVEVCRSVEREKGWSGNGSWLPGGICDKSKSTQRKSDISVYKKESRLYKPSATKKVY